MPQVAPATPPVPVQVPAAAWAQALARVAPTQPMAAQAAAGL